jgi:putative membrane protein
MKNLKKLMFAIAMIGLVAFLQSCKSNDANSYQMDNQAFVNQASSSNNFEVAAGKLAATNSSNSLVQKFGTQMVNEHTSVGTDLAAIAQSKNLNVATTLQAKDQTNINALTALTGAQFDAQFISMMIVSHQDAITLFQNASGAKGVMDGDLRNFAGSKLPALKLHLQEAQTLQSQIQVTP